MSHPGFLSQWSLSSIKEYSKIRNDSCLRNDEIKSPYLRAQIMKFRHRILLLLLFVALSANCAWACGDTDADHVAKFHHEHEHDSEVGVLGQRHRVSSVLEPRPFLAQLVGFLREVEGENWSSQWSRCPGWGRHRAIFWQTGFSRFFGHRLGSS